MMNTELQPPVEALTRFKPSMDATTHQVDSSYQARYGFKVGSVAMLIPGNKRSEVLLEPPVYPIPNTPEYFLGVCNIRGNITPIYDLFLAFGIEKTDSAPKQKQIVALGEQGQMVGLRIEQLPELVEFNEQTESINDIQPLPNELIAFVSGGYRIRDTNWHEVDFLSLLRKLSGNS